MDYLIKDLRLAIAQFNTFIIENYIVNEINDNSTNPHKYLFGIFKSLIKGLGDYGEYLGKLETANYRNSLAVLQRSLIENSITIIYVIEKSVDEIELRSVLNSIDTHFLQTSIDNIVKYGEIYKTDNNLIKDEIDQLKKDNSEYFGKDGKVIYQPYCPAIDVALKFLIDNTQLPQFKGKFKTTILSHRYFNQYLDNEDIIHIDSINELLFHLLNSLYIVLLALTYIEPFFEKEENVNNAFFEKVTIMFKWQSDVLNESQEVRNNNKLL